MPSSFFKQGVTHLSQVATLFPCTSRIAQKLAATIPDKPGTIVELGAGNGAVTRYITERMDHNTSAQSLLAFEINPNFSYDLKEQYEYTKNVRIINREAEVFSEHLNNDLVAVVSTLPLGKMPEMDVAAIAREAKHHMIFGGSFAQYQTSPFRTEQNIIKEFFPYMQTTEAWTILPPFYGRVYWGRKI